MDWRRSVRWLSLWAALGLALPGCAALLVAGAVAGTAAGVKYTWDNIAYKAFSRPLPQVEKATRAALRRMNIEHFKPRRTGKESEIQAHTARHDIYITLERVTPTTTKMSVNAVKRSGVPVFNKDKALATEIIIQTDKGLGSPGPGKEKKGKSPQAGAPPPSARSPIPPPTPASTSPRGA